MKRFLKIYLDKPELAGVALLVILLAVFQVKSGGVLLSFENLRGVMGLLPEMALVTIGVTILMICGAIYFLISFPIARFGGYLERRWSPND